MIDDSFNFSLYNYEKSKNMDNEDYAETCKKP